MLVPFINKRQGRCLNDFDGKFHFIKSFASLLMMNRHDIYLYKLILTYSSKTRKIHTNYKKNLLQNELKY